MTSMNNFEQLHLVSFKLCPYVQRSVITLLEKNIPFQRTDISLTDKPDWFLELSPTGKVPMLVVEQKHVLFESNVICQYLDEISEGSLLANNPLKRAQQKAWIEFASTVLAEIGRFYSAKQQVDFDQAQNKLRQHFERLDKQAALPYFDGAEFSLVDAAFAPVFRYFDVIEANSDLRPLEGLANLKLWRQSLSNRYSVQRAVNSEFNQDLLAFLSAKPSVLANFLRQTGQTLKR